MNYGPGIRRSSTSDRLRPAPVYMHPVTFHYKIQNHTTRMQKLTKAFRVYRLMVLTLICVVTGILLGLVCRPFAHKWTERQFMYVEFPGELFMRFLRLIIIPLLVSNVILSFGTIQGKISSRLVKVASLLYLCSNIIAILVAIVCALCIRPGSARQHMETSGPARGGIFLSDQMRRQHMFEQHNSPFTRYREYHPMFYHTSTLDDDSALDAGPLQRFIRSIGGGIDYEHANKQQMPLMSGNKNDDEKHSSTGLTTKLPIDVVLDVLRNLVPDSLIGATLHQSRTRLFTPKKLRVKTDGNTEPAPSKWPMGHEIVEQPNIIGLLAMSVLAGVVLSHMGDASLPLLDLCSCVSELSLRVGMKAIHLAPFCIMFLLIGQVARARNLGIIVGELFTYSITVLLAFIVHGFIFLPLAYYLITHKSPYEFFKGLLEALVASFATSSSSSTMALTLKCLSELKLNVVIVRAFGPLGSVFNMNGTLMFESVATIFIAQTLGITLSFTSLMLVGLCSAVASLSTAGIPSSGLMTMVIVLNAINLPVLEISLIYIVDFIIDRFRTVVNVWCGAIVCGLIDHICSEELFEEEMRPDKGREMSKYHASKSSLKVSHHKDTNNQEEKPQIISVTITPPPPADESSNI